ncbi:hypothetical protein CLOACE_22730 [Clostridium acetireducens DSM 10703]|jgi:hypothetical protein|uniref:Uncharacterized protein n=1 Tax=Clostridium acetireducens DSM 10703 TaxID=1121290 RepID=A0A1E8EUZ7_9CLOT|nr:hypothetical protein [Clostridium acetireducens]OFH98052.1 hypothetical protein CLOACE_22730 [Clostridium acetireducens DSM 10703]
MGIGIIISTFIMTTVKINISMSKYEIEKKARSMGMEYPNETKVIINKGVKK